MVSGACALEVVLRSRGFEVPACLRRKVPETGVVDHWLAASVCFKWVKRPGGGRFALRVLPV